jgi:hypothetical protein
MPGSDDAEPLHETEQDAVQLGVQSMRQSAEGVDMPWGLFVICAAMLTVSLPSDELKCEGLTLLMTRLALPGSILHALVFGLPVSKSQYLPEGHPQS